jgi:hypothetical protein
MEHHMSGFKIYKVDVAGSANSHAIVGYAAYGLATRADIAGKSTTDGGDRAR